LRHKNRRKAGEGGKVSLLIVLAALAFLIVMAYRGHSVILVAPIAAMGAVLLTDAASVAPAFSGIFMTNMANFIKAYFPVFMLGAIFGKVIEMSGFADAIVAAAVRHIGAHRAIPVIIIVSAVLTYGGVSAFVVVFAAYPFAASLFRQGDIPKRLIPATIALGAFTFTIDSLPGTPQIQNIIPTTFFGTTTWAAPVLGVIGATFIFVLGLGYLEWRRRVAAARGEGYGTGHINEPDHLEDRDDLPPAYLALGALVVVFVANFVLTRQIPHWFGESYSLHLPGMAEPIDGKIASATAIWSVLGALLLGILFVSVTAFAALRDRFSAGSKAAVGGALLASMNTAAEYGFGGVIAVLPGFLFVRQALTVIPDPLFNAAISVTTLAGITGSASGGMSIALAAMAKDFIAAADAAGIPLEVMHRVASMASGGMDTLPHNGAVITLLAVTGLTHRQSYKDIFALTLIKSAAAIFVILVYYATGLV
jgi:H+/gluconate symporter-like permease